MKITIKKDSEAAKEFESLRGEKQKFKELIESGEDKKTKETLYTEEQVRFAIEQSYSLGSAYRGVYSKKLENEIIQSLKKPKKN